MVEQCGRTRIVREEVVGGKKGDVTTVWSVHRFQSGRRRFKILFGSEVRESHSFKLTSF